MVTDGSEDFIDQLARTPRRPRPGHRDVPYPDPVDPVAFYGLAGDVVRTIGPVSEADPMALLTQFLLAFGNVIGRDPHFMVEADPHFTNEMAALVGETAKGRKGSSWGHIRALFEAVDRDWTRERVQQGLTSGEGLIWEVRNPVAGTKRGTEDVGVLDKRLLVMESELASVLQRIGREHNTLSAVLRQAWDSGRLQTMGKQSPARATETHISVIGHITRDELQRRLDRTELANGFANRFLWVAVRRAHVLPEGGRLPEEDRARLQCAIAEAIDHAHTIKEMRRSDAARARWAAVYPELSEGRPGLSGAATARAEAHVLRLSMLYALLDKTNEIQAVHLDAALAVWAYANATVQWIWGDAMASPLAEQLREAIEEAGDEGVTQAEIYDLCNRNVSRGVIGAALEALRDGGSIVSTQAPTGGRPTTRWHAINAKTRKGGA